MEIVVDVYKGVLVGGLRRHTNILGDGYGLSPRCRKDLGEGPVVNKLGVLAQRERKSQGAGACGEPFSPAAG